MSAVLLRSCASDFSATLILQTVLCFCLPEASFTLAGNPFPANGSMFLWQKWLRQVSGFQSCGARQAASHLWDQGSRVVSEIGGRAANFFKRVILDSWCS